MFSLPKKKVQQTFVLYTEKSTQKAGKKSRLKVDKKDSQKVARKVSKKLEKNTPIKHIAIYTRHMLIIRKKNFLKHIPEPVLKLV